MPRLSKIMTCSPRDPLIQALHTTGTLTQDHCWPFLQWDASKGTLVKNEKKPIGMDKMMEHITELVEMATDVTLVQRFGSLNPKTESSVVPWRLQVNLRHDRPWELLVHLTHNSIWSLLGVTFKVHTQGQSKLAKSLQDTLFQNKPKGKGEGKKGGS